MPSEKTKIAVCPYCRKAPKESGNIKTIFGVICNTSGCLLRPYAFSLADWNALCADIERGRVVDFVVKYKEELELELRKTEQHLDTAIRLLREWIVSGSYNLPKDVHQREDNTEDFLDLPAVAKILEEQKEGEQA